MKLAELSKLTNAALKRAAKARSWSSSGYVAFKREGPLFFYVHVGPSGKGGGLMSSIRYKLIAIEDLFWKITCMPANSEAALSVRANGAFAFGGTEIARRDWPDCVWTAEMMDREMESLLSDAVTFADAVSVRVRDADDNLAYIEELLSSQSEAARISPIQVLTHLLKGEVPTAVAIVEERIQAGDVGGGIKIGGHSFYEWAKWHIEAMALPAKSGS